MGFGSKGSKWVFSWYFYLKNSGKRNLKCGKHIWTNIYSEYALNRLPGRQKWWFKDSLKKCNTFIESWPTTFKAEKMHSVLRTWMPCIGRTLMPCMNVRPQTITQLTLSDIYCPIGIRACNSHIVLVSHPRIHRTGEEANNPCRRGLSREWENWITIGANSMDWISSSQSQDESSLCMNWFPAVY